MSLLKPNSKCRVSLAGGKDRKTASDHPNTLLLYPFKAGNIGGRLVFDL
ncbi:MAG: hypothetical protein Q8908_16120 [Bacteroidota bacterium]|nr:hypothetical protein [Bacteroidota bacterium]